jgi:eukaryotic-like serine/threonine-protein kinase
LLARACVALIEAFDPSQGVVEPIESAWDEGDLVANQFLVRKQLGAGGMGSVWDAYDKLMHRSVALKTTYDKARGHTTLLREARALAVVRHRGLPIAYSIGTHRGWTFMAFERLFGATVEQQLQQNHGTKRRFLVEEAVRVLVEIADILHTVHSLGMAHLDVKPGNVMLCPDQRVVLLDLGIMLAEVEVAGRIESGTPRYLAPEAFAGEIRRGEARLLDIYAFGVTAFEMLSGMPPFRSDSLTGLMRAHLQALPPDLRSMRSDVPPALAMLIDACLAKSPHDRPASMENVLWDLRWLLRM